MSIQFDPITGNLVFVQSGGGGGGSTSPGGSNKSVQYNDSSAFGGDTNFTWDKTAKLLTVKDHIQVGPLGSVTTFLQPDTILLPNTNSYHNAFVVQSNNANFDGTTGSASSAGIMLLPHDNGGNPQIRVVSDTDDVGFLRFLRGSDGLEIGYLSMGLPWGVQNSNAAFVVWKVSGMSGQSADLQQWCYDDFAIVKATVGPAGQIRATFGSASVPGLSFFGDTGTGFSNNGSNGIVISSNGSQVGSIDISGNVDFYGNARIRGLTAGSVVSDSNGNLSIGSSGFITSVSDTNSIDLNVSSSNLTADVITDPIGPLSISGPGLNINTSSGIQTVQGGGNDSFTKLLLHLDNSFTDSSSFNNTLLTSSGSSSYVSGKFSTGLDVSGGGAPYIANYPSIFSLGTGNFTFELWAKSTSIITEGYLISAGIFGVGQDYALHVSSTGVITWDNPLVATSSGAFLTDGNYHHYAFVRNGNVHTIYVDGVSAATVTSSFTYTYTSTNSLSFGCVVNGSGTSFLKFNGSIDEVRASIGVARYTTNFTPQSVAYGTNAITALVDNSTIDINISNQLEVKTGGINNAQIGASAAIALSKLAALSNHNRVLVSDGSGFISESSVTSTELTYLTNNEALTSYTLVDNQASATMIEQWTVASFSSIHIEYSVSRGSGNRASGEIKLVSDGTSASIAQYEALLGITGLTFSTDVNSGNLRLLYTSTSTGTAPVFKIKVQKWLA